MSAADGTSPTIPTQRGAMTDFEEVALLLAVEHGHVEVAPVGEPCQGSSIPAHYAAHLVELGLARRDGTTLSATEAGRREVASLFRYRMLPI